MQHRPEHFPLELREPLEPEYMRCHEGARRQSLGQRGLEQEAPGEGSEKYYQSYLFHRLHHQQVEERGERQKDFGTPEVLATESVTLTIDGREVTVPAGTSVMRAASESGGSNTVTLLT